MLSLVILFVVGLVLLVRVDVAAAVRAVASRQDSNEPTLRHGAR